MNFITELKNYAELIIREGINLFPQQKILIKTGPDTYSFAQLLAETAYKNGAGYEQIEIYDQKLISARVTYQEKEALSYVPQFDTLKGFQFIAEDWAYIRIDNTEDREALEQTDTDKLTIMQTAVKKATNTLFNSLMKHEHAWCVVCAPGKEWAKTVLGPQAEVEDLWEVLRKILRLDTENPVKTWKEHTEKLTDRCKKLTSLQLSALHITDAGTDITVGLRPEAIWIGGPEVLPNGRVFSPNIPTEEVFTVPDRLSVTGTLTTTRPVEVLGNTVEGACITLEHGKVINATAKTGEKILQKYFSIDEGASYTGEIALVDASSPIAESRHIFSSILYDENAACHIAFGAGYPTCLTQGNMLKSTEELLEAGCNVSLVHTDFMIGSPTTRVTGKTITGEEIEIMKNGSFCF